MAGWIRADFDQPVDFRLGTRTQGRRMCPHRTRIPLYSTPIRPNGFQPFVPHRQVGLLFFFF